MPPIVCQSSAKKHNYIKMSPDVKPSYRPEIDGLRALAVLAVIIYHFNPKVFPSGFFGVDVFFVISGFVVTSSLSGKPDQSWPSYLLTFYAKRIKRLIPALIFCVVLTSLVGCFFIDVDLTRDSLRTGMASLFGFSNLYILRQNTNYFGQSADLNLFTQTWSLGVEEQFYLCFPILLGVCGFARKQRKHGTRNLFLTVLTLSTLSIVNYYSLSQVQPDAAFFLMPARFWELGMGCLMFLVTTQFSGKQRFLKGRSSYSAKEERSTHALKAFRIQRLQIFLSSASMLLLIGTLFLSKDTQLLARILVVVLTCLLLWSLEQKSRLADCLSSKWMVKIGLLSYSLYLWHWSVLVISRWTIGISKWTIPAQVIAMIGLAVVSNRWIEQPLRYAKWSPKKIGILLYGLAATISSTLWLLALDTPLKGKLYTGSWFPDSHISTFTLTEAYEPCNDISSTTLSECFYPQRPASSTASETEISSPKTVYFVGDSHTGSIQSLASQLIENADVPRIMMVERDGCLFTTSLLNMDDDGDECLASNRAFLSNVLDTGKPGDVVVMTNRYTLYFLSPNSPDDIEKLDKGLFSFSFKGERLSQEQALDRYLNNLVQISEELSQRGISLVVQAPLPDWKYKPSQCHPQWFRPDFNLPPDCSLSASSESQSRADFMALFRQLESEVPNLYVYDPFPAFCNSQQCSPFSSKGIPLFRDADHLNNYGARKLYGDFVNYLRMHTLAVDE